MISTFWFFFTAYLFTVEIIILPLKKYPIPRLSLKSILTRNYKVGNNRIVDLLEVFRPGLLFILGLNSKLYLYPKWIEYYSKLATNRLVILHTRIAILAILVTATTAFLNTKLINSYLLYYTIFLSTLLFTGLLALLIRKKKS